VNEAKLSPKDIVLEIGPGTGFLTRKLLEKCRVVAIERDEIMIELLSKEFEKEIMSGKLRLINSDILEMDLDALGVNKVVSLPPYHISSKLVGKMALTNKIELAVLVFDTGFVEKLTAFEGMAEYGSLSAFLNLNAKVEALEKIEAGSFFPTPNCVSEVIKMTFDHRDNSVEYYTFLKELFRHKNKDLHRGLSQALVFLIGEIGWKREYEKKFTQLRLANKKVYALSPQQLLDVYEEVSGKKMPAKAKASKKKPAKKAPKQKK
jgi:16S rRNA A1518/A1519 N6-dimethyltransferase RsmA/KsgA/DIM1 with predicted DNA glycosylase/AP lyase activity